MFRESSNALGRETSSRQLLRSSLRSQRRETVMSSKRVVDSHQSLEMQNIPTNEDDIDRIHDTLRASSNYDTITNSLKVLRYILNKAGKTSKELEIRFYDKVINCGLLTTLINIIQRLPPAAQQHILFVFINLTALEQFHVNAAIQCGVVEHLFPLLQTDIAEDVLWVLANITSENVGCRNKVFDIAGLAILNIGGTTKSDDVLKKLQQFEPYVQFLKQVFQRGIPSVNMEVVTGLSYLLDTTVSASEYSDFIPVVISYLQCDNDEVVKSSLSCIGCVASGDDSICSQLTDYGVVEILANIINNRSDDIMSVACWALSNFCACRHTSIPDRVLSTGVVSSVLFELVTTVNLDMKHECGWIIVNLLCSLTESGLTKISTVDHFFDAIHSILCCDFTRKEIYGYCLKGLRRILIIGEAYKNNDGLNVYADAMNSASVVNEIASMIENPDICYDVQLEAQDILQTFFECYYDELGNMTY
ncbi:Importin alpha [Entamoeba marina]